VPPETLNRDKELGMPYHKGCVWIDHREAKIFGVSIDDVDEIVIRDKHSPLHIHRRADQVNQGKSAVDRAFMDEIASKLVGFRGFIIVGPGTARAELAGYLAEAYPILAKRIWGIEPADHPTEGQLVAAARKYFHAANRMHT
jgi:stalled ribosome rescue protein Dom34